MEEFARGTSKEVVGYFPTYLRQLFAQDHDPSALPLPPVPVSTRESVTDNLTNDPFKLDLAMDAQGNSSPSLA